MFSEGAVTLFTFCKAMCMLALSLALFGCFFVWWLPWFSGLVLGVGQEGTPWVLWALWVWLCVSTWARALVGSSGTGALSGIVCTVGIGGGNFVRNILFILVRLSRDLWLCTF